MDHEKIDSEIRIIKLCKEKSNLDSTLEKGIFIYACQIYHDTIHLPEIAKLKDENERLRKLNQTLLDKDWDTEADQLKKRLGEAEELIQEVGNDMVEWGFISPAGDTISKINQFLKQGK